MNIEVNVKTVGIAITIILATLGGGYEIGKDIGSDRISHLEEVVSEYKASGNLDLPQTILSLRKAANLFALKKEERDSFDSTLAENKKLSDELIKLTNALNINKKELSQLKGLAKKTEENLNYKIQKMDAQLLLCKNPSETFTLKEGQATDLIKNILTIGLRSIDYQRVSYNIDNQTKYLSVGDAQYFSFGNKKCTLRLMNMSFPAATFSFTCLN